VLPLQPPRLAFPTLHTALAAVVPFLLVLAVRALESPRSWSLSLHQSQRVLLRLSPVQALFRPQARRCRWVAATRPLALRAAST
jgi:hypothetical protein